MQIKYGLDRYLLPTKIHIVPSPNEDADWLHNMAVKMTVENPAIAFSTAAKAGHFNKFDDDQYEKILQVVKRLSLLFTPPGSDKADTTINIYDLLCRLLYEYMINNHTDCSRIV